MIRNPHLAVYALTQIPTLFRLSLHCFHYSTLHFVFPSKSVLRLHWGDIALRLYHMKTQLNRFTDKAGNALGVTDHRGCCDTAVHVAQCSNCKAS